jgi:hypothetical protein
MPGAAAYPDDEYKKQHFLGCLAEAAPAEAYNEIMKRRITK